MRSVLSLLALPLMHALHDALCPPVVTWHKNSTTDRFLPVLVLCAGPHRTASTFQCELLAEVLFRAHRIKTTQVTYLGDFLRRHPPPTRPRPLTPARLLLEDTAVIKKHEPTELLKQHVLGHVHQSVVFTTSRDPTESLFSMAGLLWTYHGSLCTANATMHALEHAANISREDAEAQRFWSPLTCGLCCNVRFEDIAKPSEIAQRYAQVLALPDLTEAAARAAAGAAAAKQSTHDKQDSKAGMMGGGSSTAVLPFHLLRKKPELLQMTLALLTEAGGHTDEWRISRGYAPAAAAANALVASQLRARPQRCAPLSSSTASKWQQQPPTPSREQTEAPERPAAAREQTLARP